MTLVCLVLDVTTKRISSNSLEIQRASQVHNTDIISATQIRDVFNYNIQQIAEYPICKLTKMGSNDTSKIEKLVSCDSCYKM